MREPIKPVEPWQQQLIIDLIGQFTRAIPPASIAAAVKVIGNPSAAAVNVAATAPRTPEITNLAILRAVLLLHPADPKITSVTKFVRKYVAPKIAPPIGLIMVKTLPAI